jgi:hypothetical protein
VIALFDIYHYISYDNHFLSVSWIKNDSFVPTLLLAHKDEYKELLLEKHRWEVYQCQGK